MEISWVTVIAQIVNFLILVWLLQKILFRPIIGAIDERREKLQQLQAEMETGKLAAEEEAARFAEMQKTFARQRDALVSEARDNANETYKKLISEMRNKVLSQKNEWLQDLASEQQTFLETVRNNTADAFSQMARKALGDLASQTLEEQITKQFIRKLHDLSLEELKSLKEAESNNSRKATIFSAYPLTKQYRHEVTRAIHERIDREMEIKFEETDSIVCGMEMRIGGYVVRWSLDSYLEDMNTDLRRELENSLAHVSRAAAE